ncbi:MAG: flagellar protein FliS [Gemmataceae bacterium]|nr:flagellar protein FliS [Gemmataceae bacterium]
MTGVQAYRRQSAPAWTRIDAILFLYRRADENLDRAESLLAAGDAAAAGPLLIETQTIVTAFASGLDMAEASSVQLLKLYEYVGHQLAQATVAALREARKTMKTLAAGFEDVQDRARQMERTGELPPFSESSAITATA